MNKKTLNSLSYHMLRIRRVEEAIADRYKEQEMRCPTHLCIGQEAIPVGVCTFLTKKDIVFSTHRSHGHYLAKGGDLRAMIAEIYGKATGCSGGYGGSQHLIDLSVNFWGSAPIVGSLIPVAVGVALSIVMKKERRIVVSFFGEAAVEEGVFSESINFAALKNLPVLFVCENNLYSTNTHIRDRQPDRPIYNIPRGLGIDSYQGDGNNIQVVEKLSRVAITRIQKGKGPQFLEFLTYRQREHVGPNSDPPGFRPEQELLYWKKKDPLRTIQNTAWDKAIKKEIDQAFLFAKKSPFPAELNSAQYLFAP